MTKKWKNIIKKTTEFSFDPELPRGKAIGRKRNTDDIQIGLPAWKRTILLNHHKTNPEEGPKYFTTKDLEGSENLIQEIANTIGHEYTHIATGEEVIESRNEAWVMLGTAILNNEDITKAIEKYITTNFIDEMMSRAAHGKMQQEVYLNRGALNKYASGNIERFKNYYIELTKQFPDQVTEEGLDSYMNKVEQVVRQTYTNLINKYKDNYID